MSDIKVEFPSYYDDLYAWEVEAKGWLQGVAFTTDGRRYSVTFYDPVTLAQDSAEEVAGGGVFLEPNLIVIAAVTRENIVAAIDAIVRTGQHAELRPDQGAAMASDIEEITRRVTTNHPEVTVTRLKVTHPADDDGLWFFSAKGMEVQLESSSGTCPFLLESDAHDRRRRVCSVEEAVRAVEEALGLG